MCDAAVTFDASTGRIESHYATRQDYSTPALIVRLGMTVMEERRARRSFHEKLPRFFGNLNIAMAQRRRSSSSNQFATTSIRD